MNNNFGNGFGGGGGGGINLGIGGAQNGSGHSGNYISSSTLYSSIFSSNYSGPIFVSSTSGVASMMPLEPYEYPKPEPKESEEDAFKRWLENMHPHEFADEKLQIQTKAKAQ